MRIVVFMNGARGEAAREALEGAGHEIILGYYAAASPGLDVNNPGFIYGLQERKPDLLVVAGFPQIFGDELLAVAPAVNLHAGPLPRYRGGSPLNWQIINGEHVLAVSIIEMDRGVDTGPVLAESGFALEDHETIADAHEKANQLFCKLVVRVVDQIATNSTHPEEQEAEGVAYYHQRNEGDGRIFWRDMSAEQVVNLVRAVTKPYPGAFTYGEPPGNDLGFSITVPKIWIWGAIVPARVIKGTPGRVLYLNGEGPFIVAADRAVQVTEYEGELPHGAHLE